MKRAWQPITALTLGMMAAAPAAQAETMSLSEVIDTILAQQPQLELSRIDSAIADTERQRIEGMLDPVVTAAVGASDETTPTISAFQASGTRLANLNGSIAKPLAGGGTLSGNFAYSRTSQSFNSPLATQLASFNPVWRNQVNVSYRHPLLKGADRPDYEQALIAANAGVAAADHQQRTAARTWALNGLGAYYQLAGDDINIRIAKQAYERAGRLLAYQRKRESFGLIETADRLQAEALRAARKTDLERASAQRASDLSSLNRLMLRDPGAPLDLTGDAPDIEPPELKMVIATAREHRPELQALQARLEAAEAQLSMARDQDRMQLDVVAEAGTRALDNNAMPAAARGLSVNDRYVGLKFELSDAISRNSAAAAIRKSELQRQRIVAERVNTMETIRNDIAAAMTTLQHGSSTLDAARKQVQAEARKFEAEMARYRQGRSDTATLVQFEGELRNAELNAELQELSLRLAARQLQWSEGMLLERLGLNSAE